MNQRLVVQLEHSVNDRTYHLHLPVGGPIGEAYDACHAMLQQIVEMAKAANDKAKQPSDSDVAASEVM